LESDYANGVSLWLHKVLKNRQRQRERSEQTPTGWLQAKAEIQEAIAHETSIKRRRTNKRRGRFDEALTLAESRRPRVSKARPQMPVTTSRSGITANNPAFDDFDDIYEPVPVFSPVQRKAGTNESC